ncbi:MAG: hypothetical protein K9N34_08965 [Candidatus Marinimicrobia bacterium]|nr:hypothetical protein [Candidatus Neomarinimicrobiota bacterium]MCF7903023.1 hypothetical protein [Candidatus Neomarinimicrobiota bacterium]
MSDGRVYGNVLLGEFGADSITIQDEDMYRIIALSNIHSIRTHPVAHTTKLVGAGILLGLIVGSTIDLDPEDELNPMEYVIVESSVRTKVIFQFALIGGILGGVGAKVRSIGWEHRLEGMSRGEKITLLQKLTEKYSTR